MIQHSNDSGDQIALNQSSYGFAVDIAQSHQHLTHAVEKLYSVSQFFMSRFILNQTALGSAVFVQYKAELVQIALSEQLHHKVGSYF